MNPMNSDSSSSRRILVTGASGALGSAVLEKFISSGDQVIAVHGIHEKPSPKPGALWLSADLTLKKSVDGLFREAGEVQAVVHCAGGFRFGFADTFSEEDFRFLVALNFEAAYYVAAAAIPGMKKRKQGTLLFVSSMATLNPSPGMSVYAATKASVNTLVTTLAAELKSESIQVNAILPSIIDTAANRIAMPSSDFSKWVSPLDLAEILYDLTLPKSKSITGALIPVSGGV